MHVGWSKPQRSWVKLNSDGAVDRHTGKVGAGGVLRDCNGDWLFGYSRNVEKCNMEQAERWGILDGHSIAWSWNFDNILIETDNRTIPDWLNSSIRPSNGNVLFDSIADLRTKHWNTKVEFVYREADIVAGLMAKKNTCFEDGLTVYTQIPDDVITVVIKDSTGTLCNPEV